MAIPAENWQALEADASRAWMEDLPLFDS